MKNERKEEDCLWTVADVGEYLRVANSTVYDWVSQEKIPYIRINRVLRFVPAEIQSWMREAARVAPLQEVQHGR